MTKAGTPNVPAFLFRALRTAHSALRALPDLHQPIRCSSQRIKLLAEREAHHRPTELAVMVEARTRNCRDADLLRHPLRERHVIQVTERREISKYVVGALRDRERKAGFVERLDEHVSTCTIVE